MQHLVLRTANPQPLMNNPGWSLNGVGRRISNKFGYGLMDAGALVRLAEKWTTVPEQHICTYEYRLSEPKYSNSNCVILSECVALQSATIDGSIRDEFLVGSEWM
jgi:hypothetical protein